MSRRISQRAVSFAFRLAKTARDSMRDLDHVKGVPGVEIFVTAVWLMTGVIWGIAIKVGAVHGMRAGIIGMAGIISVGWLVLKALRQRSRKELEDYYGQPAD